MAFSLKNIIWGLYGNWEQRSDTYKNGAGKGIRQRYNEIIAEEYDEQTQTLIDGLFANAVLPRSLYVRLLPYWEETLGVPVTGLTLADRRKLVSFALRFNQAKGTVIGLRMLLARINCECTVTETYDNGSFDNGLFDLNGGFDKSECQQFCGSYSIEAGGIMASTPELLAQIQQLAELNNPIHATITAINYTSV